MHLSDHSLQQLDEAYLDRLDEAALRGLSARLLADLKEARERLQQGPHNSSRPPSSRLPLEGGARDEPDAVADETPDPDPRGTADPAPDPEADHAAKSSAPATAPKPPKKAGAGKPGKPPGAPGFGRTQQLVATWPCFLLERRSLPASGRVCGSRPESPALQLPVWRGAA